MTTKSPLFRPVGGPRLGRRFISLMVGLVLFGVGTGLMVKSELGVAPWDVLHQGLARKFGWTVGVWSILVSIAVLVLWLPLRERYGIGTLFNAIVVGLTIDATTTLVPVPTTAPGRWVTVFAGIVAVGFASGLYIGAGLGPGPRDGLMTGIAKLGPSIRLTRTLIEGTVLTLGWVLGGTVGLGTVGFAVLIGPLVQFFLPRLRSVDVNAI